MVWTTKWDVPSTDGKRLYVVARKDNGMYGCSCPAWKFQKGTPRRPCKHVKRIMGQQADYIAPKEDIKFVVPKVGRPIPVLVIPAQPISAMDSQRVARMFNFDE
jgi:hypothetical protein